jgi:hypothetical protein
VLSAVCVTCRGRIEASLLSNYYPYLLTSTFPAEIETLEIILDILPNLLETLGVPVGNHHRLCASGVDELLRDFVDIAQPNLVSYFISLTSNAY